MARLPNLLVQLSAEILEFRVSEIASAGFSGHRYTLLCSGQVRGHFQTIFFKINVIMTLRGEGVRAMMLILA